MRILLALLLLLPGLTLRAQMHRYSTNFTLSEKNFCDTVSIEFERNQVYVPVEMNGHTYRFLLDTGSSQGVVYADSPIAGCRQLGHIVSHDAVGRQDTVQVVGLPPFRLGQLGINGYVATVHRRQVSRRQVDGILGFDLFNKGIIGKIDVQNRRLILTDRRHGDVARETGYALKYKLRWFVPHVWVGPFLRHQDQALFDTGSRQLYAMNKQSFDRHQYMSRQVQQQVEGRSVGQLAIGNFGVEQQDSVVFLALDRLKWGDFWLYDVHCITTRGGSHVGAPLLNYGTLTINPFKRQLVLQSYDHANSVTVGNEQFQIAFVPRDGRAAVGLIWEQSEAYKNGFRQGDVVLRIDDRDVPDFQSFVDYPFILGQEHRFTLRDRQGNLKEVHSKR